MGPDFSRSVSCEISLQRIVRQLRINIRIDRSCPSRILQAWAAPTGAHAPIMA
jgi:hypothetical protein